MYILNLATLRHDGTLIDWLIDPELGFFIIKCDTAPDRNPGPGYNTLFLRLISGDLYSACPQRQFHTLTGLLQSQAALSNFYPYACVPSMGQYA